MNQYERDIIKLLELFRDKVADSESNAWVLELASNPDRWSDAHRLFDDIRARNLEAINRRDLVRESQYCFEEVCLQLFYNETHPPDPFDSSSPYWVIKNALALARAVDIPVERVVDLLAPVA